MNWLSIALSLALAGMIVLLAVALPFAILRNLANGHERRRRLAARIADLRLGRMLDGLGENRTEYLHTQRVVDIEHHMRRCKDCDATELCDNLLDTGQAINPATADFCPNMGDFRAAPR